MARTTSASPNQDVTAVASFFQGYVAAPEVYDETFAAPGKVRPHWQQLVHAFETLGGQELTRRWEQARRLLDEHDVTYNVHGDPQGFERPWDLDAIPLLLPEPEWQRLETALIQRARLLNALLADVYGPQRLVNEGFLPPELVFAHPGFLRPCYGIPVPHGCYLHFYALDLARRTDGQWCVVADRAQIPTGAGGVLENRLILANTLSDVIHESHVQPLAAFFDTLRHTLFDLAPRQRDHPRIVLMTPGAHSDMYFEHVYVARYLGFTLVTGADLTVRDGGVFLKTLAGLQPVDVILRWQDDTLCDPLTLEQSSQLGTAGLVQAVRAGNVAVANALGSGWLESSALLPFLPTLCRCLLAEELRLPSRLTWWCGQPAALAYVLDRLQELEIVPAFGNGTPASISVSQRRRTSQQRLGVMLRARPYAFVAQAPLLQSTVPVWSPTGIHPGSVVLRVYLAATTDGYVVMPGGLTRVRRTPYTPLPSLRQGGEVSKDTWVISSSPQQAPTIFAVTAPPITIRRSGYDLPSRVADDFLWLGRYAERTEGAIRLLRSVLQRLSNAAATGSAALPTLLQAVCERWQVPSMGPEPTWLQLEGLLLTVMYDAQLSDSLRANLAVLHRVAARVRDRMSLDAWRIVAHLEQDFSQPLSLIPFSQTLGLLNQTLTMLAAFSGLGTENMTRGPGWLFLDMGRRLERAGATVGLLSSTLIRAQEHERAVLDTVLEIADSSMTYRSRYLTTLQFAPVLDLLLTDDSNPRSVVYQLVALSQHVERLPRDLANVSLSPVQRLTMTMLTAVRLAEIAWLCEVDRAGQRSHLASLLTQLAQTLPALAETITHRYLSHAEPTRHLAVHRQAQRP